MNEPISVRVSLTGPRWAVWLARRLGVRPAVNGVTWRPKQ